MAVGPRKGIPLLALNELEVPGVGLTHLMASSYRSFRRCDRSDKEVGLLLEYPVVVQGVSKVVGVAGRHEGRLHLLPMAQAGEDRLPIAPVRLGEGKLGDQALLVDRRESRGFTADDDPEVGRRQDVIFEKRVDRAGERGEMTPHILTDVVERNWGKIEVQRHETASRQVGETVSRTYVAETVTP